MRTTYCFTKNEKPRTTLIRPVRVFAPLCPVYVSEAAQKTSRDAVQIHGGNGFTVSSGAGTDVVRFICTGS